MFKNIHTNFHDDWSINGVENSVDNRLILQLRVLTPLLGVGAKIFINTVLAPVNEP